MRRICLIAIFVLLCISSIPTVGAVADDTGACRTVPLSQDFAGMEDTALFHHVASPEIVLLSTAQPYSVAQPDRAATQWSAHGSDQSHKPQPTKEQRRTALKIYLIACLILIVLPCLLHRFFAGKQTSLPRAITTILIYDLFALIALWGIVLIAEAMLIEVFVTILICNVLGIAVLRAGRQEEWEEVIQRYRDDDDDYRNNWAFGNVFHGTRIFYVWHWS